MWQQELAIIRWCHVSSSGGPSSMLRWFAVTLIEHQKQTIFVNFCEKLKLRPRTFITSGSLGVMGAGLPFAIGAQATFFFWQTFFVGRTLNHGWTMQFFIFFCKLFGSFFGCQVANPDALTILIDGDGSFGMTNMDLQTVKRWDHLLFFHKQRACNPRWCGVFLLLWRYKLPIKMAVMNDHRQTPSNKVCNGWSSERCCNIHETSRQQMVWIWQRLFFEGRYISVFCPDFCFRTLGDWPLSFPVSNTPKVTNDNPDFVALSKAPFLCSNFESSMVKMQLLAGIRNQGTSLWQWDRPSKGATKCWWIGQP